MRDLGIDVSAELEGALAIVGDPECYKSREIPRAAGVVRRAKDEIDRARESLRAGVAGELDEYRASFESTCDLNALPEESRHTFAKLFERAADKLSVEQSPLRIQTFLESFKRNNAAMIVALLNPPKPEPPFEPEAAEIHETGGDPQPEPARPRAPRTCELSSLRVGAYSRPTIKSRQDVDDYLEALRAELEAKVDDGIIVTR